MKYTGRIYRQRVARNTHTETLTPDQSYFYGRLFDDIFPSESTIICRFLPEILPLVRHDLAKGFVTQNQLGSLPGSHFYVESSSGGLLFHRNLPGRIFVGTLREGVSLNITCSHLG